MEEEDFIALCPAEEEKEGELLDEMPDEQQEADSKDLCVNASTAAAAAAEEAAALEKVATSLAADKEAADSQPPQPLAEGDLLSGKAEDVAGQGTLAGQPAQNGRSSSAGEAQAGPQAADGKQHQLLEAKPGTAEHAGLMAPSGSSGDGDNHGAEAETGVGTAAALPGDGGGSVVPVAGAYGSLPAEAGEAADATKPASAEGGVTEKGAPAAVAAAVAGAVEEVPAGWEGQQQTPATGTATAVNAAGDEQAAIPAQAAANEADGVGSGAADLAQEQLDASGVAAVGGEGAAVAEAAPAADAEAAAASTEAAQLGGAPLDPGALDMPAEEQHAVAAAAEAQDAALSAEVQAGKPQVAPSQQQQAAAAAGGAIATAATEPSSEAAAEVAAGANGQEGQEAAAAAAAAVAVPAGAEDATTAGLPLPVFEDKGEALPMPAVNGPSKGAPPALQQAGTERSSRSSRDPRRPASAGAGAGAKKQEQQAQQPQPKQQPKQQQHQVVPSSRDPRRAAAAQRQQAAAGGGAGDKPAAEGKPAGQGQAGKDAAAAKQGGSKDAPTSHPKSTHQAGGSRDAERGRERGGRDQKHSRSEAGAAAEPSRHREAGSSKRRQEHQLPRGRQQHSPVPLRKAAPGQGPTRGHHQLPHQSPQRHHHHQQAPQQQRAAQQHDRRYESAAAAMHSRAHERQPPGFVGGGQGRPGREPPPAPQQQYAGRRRAASRSPERYGGPPAQYSDGRYGGDMRPAKRPYMPGSPQPGMAGAPRLYGSGPDIPPLGPAAAVGPPGFASGRMEPAAALMAGPPGFGEELRRYGGPMPAAAAPAGRMMPMAAAAGPDPYGIPVAPLSPLQQQQQQLGMPGQLGGQYSERYSGGDMRYAPAKSAGPPGFAGDAYGRGGAPTGPDAGYGLGPAAMPGGSRQFGGAGGQGRPYQPAYEEPLPRGGGMGGAGGAVACYSAEEPGYGGGGGGRQYQQYQPDPAYLPSEVPLRPGGGGGGGGAMRHELMPQNNHHPPMYGQRGPVGGLEQYSGGARQQEQYGGGGRQQERYGGGRRQQYQDELRYVDDTAAHLPPQQYHDSSRSGVGGAGGREPAPMHRGQQLQYSNGSGTDGGGRGSGGYQPYGPPMDDLLPYGVEAAPMRRDGRPGPGGGGRYPAADDIGFGRPEGSGGGGGGMQFGGGNIPPAMQPARPGPAGFQQQQQQQPMRGGLGPGTGLQQLATVTPVGPPQLGARVAPGSGGYSAGPSPNVPGPMVPAGGGAAGAPPEQQQIWFYLDPKGVVQGPHSIAQFRKWLDSLSQRPDLRQDYLAFRSVAVFKQDGGMRVPLSTLLG